MGKISVDLQKLGGTFIESNGKQFVLVPYDKNYIDVFKRKDGTTGINAKFQTFDRKEPKTNDNGFTDIGFLKPDYKNEYYKTLTKEQKDEIPICGNVSEYEAKAPLPEKMNISTVGEPIVPKEQTEDMPF